MNPNVTSRGIEPTAEPNSHQEFRELCALSARGHLSSDEHSRLERHLAGCSACSDLLKDYKRIARLGLSSVGPDLMPDMASVAPLGSTAATEILADYRRNSRGGHRVCLRVPSWRKTRLTSF